MSGLPTNKRVVHTGHGEIPEFRDGTKAIFHYRVQKSTSTDQDHHQSIVIDDSRQPWPHGYGQPMELIYGKQFKLAIWEQCLRTMRVDETAEFLLETQDILNFPFVSKQLRDLSKKSTSHGHDHDHDTGGSCGSTCMGMVAQTGLGYQELDDWVREPQPLRFTFHLLDVLQPDQYEREGWQMSAEQKLVSVPELRESGNSLFRQGHLAEAQQKYAEALQRLDTLVLREKPGEPEWLVLDQQKLPLYLNLAQIKLQQKEFYAAVEACDEALKRDGENAKALYRRGKAHAGAWNFAEARADFEKLRAVDATCATMADKELQTIAQSEQETKNREAERLRNIFQ